MEIFHVVDLYELQRAAPLARVFERIPVPAPGAKKVAAKRIDGGLTT